VLEISNAKKRRAPQQARADGADPAIFQLGL
jgi:hypothetical protein